MSSAPAPAPPGTTLSRFHHHWRLHGSLVTKFMLDAGVVEYRQHHITRDSVLGTPVIDCDGIADVFVRESGYARFVSAFEGREYREVVRPDEERFLDVDRMEVGIGEEVGFVVGGKAVEN
ncbi:hypothetical protein EDC01DRAFT_762485 [Geopyxis carbonaria]|nr:hypothetical protein EDC01DRAFT_762485 [Geopyxis carbonaria]